MNRWPICGKQSQDIARRCKPRATPLRPDFRFVLLSAAKNRRPPRGAYRAPVDDDLRRRYP